MRLIRLGLVIVAAAGMGFCISACETTQPGVKSSQFKQYTTIEAGTAEATKAAEGVLKDLGLHDVTSSSTNVDGWAKGFMADKTPVNVSLERVGEKTSDISVHVGSFGDPSLGSDIIGRVRKSLGLAPPTTAPAGK